LLCDANRRLPSDLNHCPHHCPRLSFPKRIAGRRKIISPSRHFQHRTSASCRSRHPHRLQTQHGLRIVKRRTRRRRVFVIPLRFISQPSAFMLFSSSISVAG
jgi:hypothetical protein